MNWQSWPSPETVRPLRDVLLEPVTIRRILAVVRWPVGGIRTYLKYVYPILNRQLGGVDISMIVPAVEEFEVLKQDLIGLNIRYINVDRDCTAVKLAQSINRELAEGPFDLIHSHGFTAALSASTVAKFRDVPHLATVHDIFQDTQFVGLKGTALRVCFRFALGMVDVVQAVGEDAGRNLVAHLGSDFASHVRVVRNGILTEPVLHSVPRDLRAELKLDVNAFLIGFFGRFMAQKGFGYLVKAIRLLRDRRRAEPPRPFHVVSFGGGGFIREEQAALERSGLNTWFTFLPFTADIASALKSVDVVAIPSLWEAMPLLPMEAMVAGVPVIGTSCIGLGEVLADSPATVIPARDSIALANALESEAQASSRQAAERFVPLAAERFDVTRTVSELIELMGSLTAAGKARGGAISGRQRQP
jgi:glycosyltransferase involved in cell wall biosynthesis